MLGKKGRGDGTLQEPRDILRIYEQVDESVT